MSARNAKLKFSQLDVGNEVISVAVGGKSSFRGVIVNKYEDRWFFDVRDNADGTLWQRQPSELRRAE